MDFSAYYLGSRALKKEMAIVYTMGVHYSEYVVALLLVLQIVFAIGSIQSGFKTINDALQELIDTRIIDSDQDKNKNASRSLDNLTVGKYIRALAVSYNSLCNDVKTCNVDNGRMMFIMLGAFTMYLIVSSYYLVMIYCLPDILHRNLFYVCLQLMWCSFRFTKIFILVESCHRTHEEMFAGMITYITIIIQYRVVDECNQYY
ncbi:unnamed protein product, partial [Iphiclides podalirius]